MEDQHIISNKLVNSFYKWLGINLNSVTWQGRFKDEFEAFWQLLFQDGLEFSILFQRISQIEAALPPGPLRTWIKWLQEKFLIFLYLYQGMNIRQLSQVSLLDIGSVATLIRNHLAEAFPQYIEELSGHFQISGNLDSKINQVSNVIIRDLNITLPNKLNTDDPLLYLEVTLYKEFALMMEILQEESVKPVMGTGILSHHFFPKIKYLIELIAMVILAVVLFYCLKWINQVNEERITNAIKSFEPKYFKVETSLKFREKNEVVNIQSEGISPDLDNVEDEYSKIEEDEIKEEDRLGTESDVELTSWDSLPKDFSTADLETSQYEEIDKGGFRDSSHGSKKVYRVMMKSTNTIETREKLNSLITKYSVEKGDKVLPGTFVPGGVYYNLFVPREFLKEFIAQVMIESESILYESKTSSINPPGKTKVFVWIKNI
jgi:hypothetical protein